MTIPYEDRTKVWYGRIGKRWYVSYREDDDAVTVRNFRSGARAKEYADVIAEIEGCKVVLVVHN